MTENGPFMVLLFSLNHPHIHILCSSIYDWREAKDVRVVATAADVDNELRAWVERYLLENVVRDMENSREVAAGVVSCPR